LRGSTSNTRTGQRERAGAAGLVAERKHQAVVEPFCGQVVTARGRDDAFNPLDVACAGEQRGCAAEAQTFDFLPLAGIELDGGDVALAFIGTAGAGQRGSGAGKDHDRKHEATATADQSGHLMALYRFGSCRAR
jgi:hypothetical protein